MPPRDEGANGSGGTPPEENAQGTQGNDEGAGTETPPQTPQSWDEVIEALPETHRSLYNEHTQGLRSALDEERRQRKDLSKQLRDAMEEATEGSEAREALEALQANLDEAEQRADFAEEAVRQGVANPRLAWLAARQVEAFDRRGNPDWDALKQAFPELFRKPTVPPAHAGAGTETPPPSAASMNQLIRQAAGRGE